MFVWNKRLEVALLFVVSVFSVLFVCLFVVHVSDEVIWMCDVIIVVHGIDICLFV